MEDMEIDGCPEKENGMELDCYPYSFSPLLLFANDGYFDKGYSNYNSVARFFESVVSVDMLHNVLYDRKNMLYEELLEYVTKHNMLVTCCIDSHFTAFQVVNGHSKTPGLVYYDPCSPTLRYFSGKGFTTLASYLLLKCNYADSQHIQENREHYVGALEGTQTRRIIYQLWKKINVIAHVGDLGGLSAKSIPLDINEYLFVNSSSSPTQMSTQLTSNTCYFQTFLFGVLCRVGELSLNAKCTAVCLDNQQALKDTTAAMCRHVMEFFVDPSKSVMRPLTNSNIVCDFFRFRSAPYYSNMVNYLRKLNQSVPQYEAQYDKVMEYFNKKRCLHLYDRFNLDGSMSSTPNTKSLQMVTSTDDAHRKLARGDYYKYRAATFMFGFNADIMGDLRSFVEFNALRKNQLLRFYDKIRKHVSDSALVLNSAKSASKYRDYYFMPQFEVGQQELIDLHHFLFAVDLNALVDTDPALIARLHEVNQALIKSTFYSTSKFANYDKLLDIDDVKRSKKLFKPFLNLFLSIDFFRQFVALGFSDINPKEKDINSLTQSVFYTTELMSQQANRRSFEFEKECINQMARSNLRKYSRRIANGPEPSTKYKMYIKIGLGYTYSKYNTLMHFLNVVEQYWDNPDMSNIQIFGKDIRALLAVCSQKLFFDAAHSGFYHYGPFESATSSYSSHREELDLAVASSVDHIVPAVAKSQKKKHSLLVLTDRVYEFNYLKGLVRLLLRSRKERIRTDNEVLNLCLLSLMLDLGLYQEYNGLLNLPFLESLQHRANTQELQVEVANLIYEFDRKNSADSVTRGAVEELLFECGYKFLVNKDFNTRSAQFQLIRMLNSDPDYQSYVLLVKVYLSLCQINKSVEVDFYKVQMHGEFRIIIPHNFSKRTSDYLIDVTKRYTFSERNNIMIYDDLQIFDLKPQQPEINLFKVRFDSNSSVESMVKYIEISHAFQIKDSVNEYLIFIADNVLLVEGDNNSKMTIRINKVPVEIATMYFNEAMSFIPCFTYEDSEDVVLFTSRNIHYMVDKGGQFATDYYGMRHELIESITSHEVYVDANDEHVFKTYKLSELLSESKTVLYYPDYLLQVSDRQHLIDLLDLSIQLRNISFFILVLFYLRRSSVNIGYIAKEDNVDKISGPWKEAILYVLNREKNEHYDAIFGRQFFDLHEHSDIPLDSFIDILCDNFTKYQRYIDGGYQIIPTAKQKSFLKRIICAEECFHFSEVGSGKTKVIMPLLCQIFLSNNVEAHDFLSRGGVSKKVLVILVPEHLVPDARTQVLRYSLNLNFREEYHVYDSVFALLHDKVQLSADSKKIFVTSFNQFKKALTSDIICKKVRPHRESMLVVADEVDDFLDRDKLVFNICSNKSSTFDRPTLDLYFEVCRATYEGKTECPPIPTESTSNPSYWVDLFQKFTAIHTEIQDASRSINKSFGIFNEYTLRHCSTNIVHDIEGYKTLIARPYESVNRAMPGSYYSDVERTFYLTYVILTEDISKYDGLFQAERKYITFEYWNSYFVHQLEFDDLVYGHEKLSEIVEKHPGTRDGLARFLYEIILRRMEIRDKSRSVNSVDVVFNFDCIGFTGTPFLDNYPTFGYIRDNREDEIPDMIDRSFYAYTSDSLSTTDFEARFERFQGQNNKVMVQYVPSEFIRDSSCEMETLESIFLRQEQAEPDKSNGDCSSGDTACAGVFNSIVDLCGIFKLSSIHDVRDLIKRHFGPDRFHYVYHIGQADSSDRVLSIHSDNDVQYDEDFYRYLCSKYGADLRRRVFFFVDNRNVIGKDIPFQLVYQKHFHQPLLTKTVVLAHDVDDWSKIWQAMGRSRTMNETVFSIYKSGVDADTLQLQNDNVALDIKQQPLTRLLYTGNCDRKMAGNISSVYLTLIALFNLSKGSFYYKDEIVNAFLDKMEQKIDIKIAKLVQDLREGVLSTPVPARILLHILVAKFRRSANPVVASEQLLDDKVSALLGHVVGQKFERREKSGDVYDELVRFLSGEQNSEMEVSYTKQQQKQKQKQQNKNQDSDAMGIFDKKNQLVLSFECDNYFKYTLKSEKDMPKLCLNLPSPVPIVTICYRTGQSDHTINVYPTLQFLYSHYIQGEYITADVQDFFNVTEKDMPRAYKGFLRAAELDVSRNGIAIDSDNRGGSLDDPALQQLSIRVIRNLTRQSPEYSIAGLQKGSYVIGTKDQFNVHDLASPGCLLGDRVQYIADEVGFILYDITSCKSVDAFGPYFVEQYILMEVLSKQEVAQNVLDYYCNHRETLQRGLDSYDQMQGKGFVSWRFLMNETVKLAAKEQKKAKTKKTDGYHT